MNSSSRPIGPFKQNNTHPLVSAALLIAFTFSASVFWSLKSHAQSTGLTCEQAKQKALDCTAGGLGTYSEETKTVDGVQTTTYICTVPMEPQPVTFSWSCSSSGPTPPPPTPFNSNYIFQFNNISPVPSSVTASGAISWKFFDTSPSPVLRVSANAIQAHECYIKPEPDYINPSPYYVGRLPNGCDEDSILITKGATEFSAGFSGGSTYTDVKLNLFHETNHDSDGNALPLSQPSILITAVPSMAPLRPATCTSTMGPLISYGIGFSQSFRLEDLPGSKTEYSVHCEPAAVTFTANVVPAGPSLRLNTVLIHSASFSSSNYKIIKTVDGKENSDEISQMDPAVKKCGQLRAYDPFKEIHVKCVETSTNLPCTFDVAADLSLELGPENGGHDHLDDRPLGALNGTQITSSSNSRIPIVIAAGSDGVVVKYHSPEVSGDVKLAVAINSPPGKNLNVTPTTIRIKNKDAFKQISAAGLSLIVESHSSGTYGTLVMNAQVQTMVEGYYATAIEPGPFPGTIPSLVSEAASLPLGGLFDIYQKWHQPHCSHRNGKAIDLSLSVFNGPNKDRLKKALQRAIKDALLKMPYALESQNNPRANHWHVTSN